MVLLSRWISAHYISFGFNMSTEGQQILNSKKEQWLNKFLENDLG